LQQALQFIPAQLQHLSQFAPPHLQQIQQPYGAPGLVTPWGISPQFVGAQPSYVM
jgi:hypothetical protein